MFLRSMLKVKVESLAWGVDSKLRGWNVFNGMMRFGQESGIVKCWMALQAKSLTPVVRKGDTEGCLFWKRQ